MDRFHKAARDGYLEVLREATRKACNGRDEDGMTPTLWAAFEGNLDALRLLVGRGGDPDKCDNYGNTALHFAAARGHMNCVSFLVNFGVNLWALDIDFHTAKELAVMNNRDDILRFLDDTEMQEENKNRKRAKLLQEKAKKEAEKRVKEFEKLQDQAEKIARREQLKLDKKREKMSADLNGINSGYSSSNSSLYGTVSSPGSKTSSIAFLSLNKKPKQFANSPNFSDLVNNSQKRVAQGGASKKIQSKLKQNKDTASRNSDFKIAEVEEDGKRSVRSLSGLRRDNEIMYVPKYDVALPAGKRGKIPDSFVSQTDLTRSMSEPDFIHPADSGFADDSGSMFERRGLGSIAFFRTPAAATLNAVATLNGKSNGKMYAENDSANASDRGSDRPSIPEDSIGSAGSIAQEDDDFLTDEEEEDLSSPLERFLAAWSLSEILPVFVREKIDMESLMLLSDQDLISLGLQMGPRRKILQAIQTRKKALEDPGEVSDTRL